jgi:hypothetical protein
MHVQTILAIAIVVCGLIGTTRSDEVSVRTMPPVVVKTVPQSGDTKVDPAIKDIRITFSKKMVTTDYSVVNLSDDTAPKLSGKPRFLEDKKTCVLSVKLEPGQTYAVWLNTDKFGNFKDASGKSAVPYLLIFETKEKSAKKAEE